MSIALDVECLPCAVGEVARSAGGVASSPSDKKFGAETPLSALPTSPLLRRGDSARHEIPLSQLSHA